MRTIALLGLCILLTACAALESTAENRALTPKPPEYTTQPTVSDLLETRMSLHLWNEVQGRYEIHMIDVSTGQDVPRHLPFVVGENQFIGPQTISSNGQKLAIVAADGEYCYPSGGGTACMGRADVLHIIDQQVWHEVTASLSGKGWAGPMSFSPDTMRLVLIFNEQKSSIVMLFDTHTGELIAQQEIAFHPSFMAHTSDGATLVLYGQPLGSNPGISKPDPPRVMLMDATTLEVRWEQELPGIVSGYWCVEKCDESHSAQTFVEWSPAVVLSPEQGKLYVVHADEEQLTTIDLNTRVLHTVKIGERQSLLDRLLVLTAGIVYAKGESNGVFKAGALSLDGTRLYVIGQKMSTIVDSDGISQGTKQSMGLDVIEVTTGQKLMSAERAGTWIRIMPDQVHLLLGTWGEGQTYVLDTDSLKSVADLGQWDIVATRGSSGQQIILASQSGQSLTRLAVLDPVTFHIIRSWSLATSYASWVATP